MTDIYGFSASYVISNLTADALVCKAGKEAELPLSDVIDVLHYLASTQRSQRRLVDMVIDLWKSICWPFV